MINTTRLRLHPASENEMNEFIARQSDEELKAAYTQMLNGALDNPEQWAWYAIWMIELKDKTHIGEFCFTGLDTNGVAEIGYGISKEYRGHGYASEAVAAAVQWAFKEPRVKALEAETDSNNTASKKVLEKCGFVLNGKTGSEGPRYTLKR